MRKNLILHISPVWSEIDNARKQLSEFLIGNNVDLNLQHTVIMVSSELLENAIKYGETETAFPISLEIDIGINNIIIEVKDKINALQKKNLSTLDHHIQWIKGFQSPFEAFIEKLKTVSAKDLDDMESGLGLVRIAYEGQGDIDFYLDENDVVCISAVVPGSI